MDDRGAGALRISDRGLEDAGMGADGAGVRGEVEVQPGGGWKTVEIRLPAGGRIERDEPEIGTGQRDPGGVVGVVGVGEQDRPAALAQHQRQLEQGLLPAGHDGDLAVRVELDAVLGAVPAGDRLPERRQAVEGGIAVAVGAGRRLRQRLDDVRGRPRLGVAAAEIDHPRAAGSRRRGDPPEQRREVLLRKAVEPPRAPARLTACLTHRGDRTCPSRHEP